MKKNEKITSLLEKDYKYSLYIKSFLFTLVLIFIFAFMRRIAPFGKYNLMAIDAWGQYFPMLREAERAFFSGSPGYSFSGALGFDRIAQSAYYTNSPLWILIYLLPGEITPWEADMAVFFRFALCALTFSVYLSDRTGKKDISVIIFSAFYAFSGYTLAYINQLMWMDAVICLPLILMGAEHIFEGKKGLIYFLFLALTIFSNFYIAFSVCIFAVLWFIVTAVIKKVSIKEFFRAFMIFTACSLGAGLINLPVLIHVLGAIKNTMASDMGFTQGIGFYNSPADMLMRLLPFQKLSLDSHIPNVYFGAVCLIAALSALLIKNKTREKICFSLLLSFLFLSFNLNILDFVWHGFHFPNQLPARYSFVFIFTALICAYYGFMNIRDNIIKDSEKRKKAENILLTAVLLELVLNSGFIFLSDIRTTGTDSILRNNEAMTYIHENYTPDKKENEFWRVERIPPRYNGGQLFGYNGISHYSSTMSADCYNFFLQLGMEVYARNVSTKYIPDPVLNALFGIKYIADTEKTDKPMCSFKESAGDMYIYENNAVLPAAYVADSEIKNTDMTLKGKAFINDIFCKASGTENVIGEDFFNEDEFIKGFEKLSHGSLEIEKIRNSYIEGRVNPAADGVLMISLPADDVKIYIDGAEVPVLTLAGYMAGADISAGEHNIKICF